VNSGTPDRPTENEEAYDLYLRGLHFLRKPPFQENALKARDRFQAAIDLDPDYAQAHAQLSLSMITMANFFVLSPSEALPQAKEAANAALALDEALFEAHVALGWVALSYERSWSQAETEFRRAIVLAPGDYQAYRGLARALQVTGRYDEALESLLKARDADPMALWVRSALADFYYKLRDYDTALEFVQSLLEMTPDDATWLAYKGKLYAQKQEPLKALNYAEKASSLAGGDLNIALNIALIYAMLGDQSGARKILQQIDLGDETRHVSPGLLAAVHANLGENDLAMENLARAVEEYDSSIWNLDYPMFDAIRPDPRFKKMCEDLQMACTNIPALAENR
jgi:tetratricopeptide (TPR) repeat protein